MTDQTFDTDATIVFVHGLWLTPRSWEHWVDRYATRGEKAIAPAWPGMDVEVEALRDDPSVMNGLGVVEVADHYDKIIRTLDAPPIIIGHSFGGAITQILLDRGLGSAGIAISPAPVKGVLRLPISALKASFPVLKNPGNKSKTVALTPQQFHYAFTNTLDDEESQAAYDRYQVPGPGRPLFQAAFANLNPNAATKVNFKNNDRAPLLIVAATQDHTVPASLSREAYTKHHKHSTAVTEYKEYAGRSHFTVGAPGWEQVADELLDWATKNKRS